MLRKLLFFYVALVTTGDEVAAGDVIPTTSCYDNTNSTEPVLLSNCTRCYTERVGTDAWGTFACVQNSDELSCEPTVTWSLTYQSNILIVSKQCSCCADGCNSGSLCSVSNDSDIQMYISLINSAKQGVDMSFVLDITPISCYDGPSEMATLASNCSACSKYTSVDVKANLEFATFQCNPINDNPISFCQPSLSIFKVDNNYQSELGKLCSCCSDMCNNDTYCSALFGTKNPITGLSTTSSTRSTTKTTVTKPSNSPGGDAVQSSSLTPPQIADGSSTAQTRLGEIGVGTSSSTGVDGPSSGAISNGVNQATKASLLSTSSDKSLVVESTSSPTQSSMTRLDSSSKSSQPTDNGINILKRTSAASKVYFNSFTILIGLVFNLY